LNQLLDRKQAYQLKAIKTMLNDKVSVHMQTVIKLSLDTWATLETAIKFFRNVIGKTQFFAAV
jgi:hypothetical protein